MRFRWKNKKKNAHKSLFTPKRQKKWTSFCNPKLKTRTKKRKKNLPKKGLEKEEKEAKEKEKEGKDLLKRDTLLVAGTSPLPLSLFFSTRYALIRNSPQRTDTRTRAKKEKGRNARSRDLSARSREKATRFLCRRVGGKREREREFNSRFEGRKEFL